MLRLSTFVTKKRHFFSKKKKLNKNVNFLLLKTREEALSLLF